MGSEIITPVVVLDTNVVVSGLLKADHSPARVLSAVLRTDVTIALDARILTEYRDVLLRPRFGFNPTLVEFVLEALSRDAIAVATLPWALPLPDPDDCRFLEVASSVQPYAVIVTGNSRHFPVESCAGVRVETPGQYLQQLSKK